MKNTPYLLKLFDMGRDLAQWYQNAREGLARFSQPDIVADVLAITSPRVALSRNCRLTGYYLRGEKLPACLPNVKRALTHWEKTREIRGPKIGPFAEALKGNLDALVLDVHMARAFDVPQARLFRSDIYRGIRNRMANIMRKTGLKMAECQAAIWSGSMRIQGRNPRFFPVHLIDAPRQLELF